jgi:negative regulator of sigma E activity
VLINKYTGERAVRVWIDRATKLVLKKEEYHANGSIASQTRFEEIRYTGSIPDGLFSTDIPAGYSQVAGQDVALPSPDVERVIRDAGFSPIEPKNLPQGFAVEGGDVSNVNGVRTLHLLYSDGLRSISLFENATGAAADFGTLRPKTIYFEGHDAQYVEDGPTTLLTWKEHHLNFALVGDLMRNELVEIAKSVVE